MHFTNENFTNLNRHIFWIEGLLHLIGANSIVALINKVLYIGGTSLPYCDVHIGVNLDVLEIADKKDNSSSLYRIVTKMYACCYAENTI